jgi:hypothetical protein
MIEMYVEGESDEVLTFVLEGKYFYVRVLAVATCVIHT